jgi:hypothetical protein
MNALRNNKILVAVIAAAALAAAFWFLALSPKRKEAADLQTKITAKQGELQQAQSQIATYTKARDSYKADYAVLARLGKAVPADDDIRSFMVQLNSAADTTHVDFAKLDVGGASGSSSSSTPTTTTTTTSGSGALAPPPGTVSVGSSGISAMPFQLTFGGDYFNLTHFFARLDRFVSVHNQHVSASGRLLRVESITITPSTGGWPTMTALVAAATYLVAPSGADGATPSGGAAATSTPATPASTPTTPTTPSTTTATVTGAAR